MYQYDKQEAPVGLLDSGLGGLTVLRTTAKYLPYENFIYYADLLHSPFGGRFKKELIEILENVVTELLQRKVKALVFASNTATSAAIDFFRNKLKIPLVGLEPALKPAVQNTLQGKILVLATELTLREEKFKKLHESYQSSSNIILKSCPGLVEIIDAGLDDSTILENYLSILFEDIDCSKIQTVVLGCTHYIIIKKKILKHFNPHVLCFDGNEGAARRLTRILSEENLLNTTGRKRYIEFISSIPEHTCLLKKQYQLLE